MVSFPCFKEMSMSRNATDFSEISYICEFHRRMAVLHKVDAVQKLTVTP